MTVVIMDRSTGPLPPFRDWLAGAEAVDGSEDITVLTSRLPSEQDGGAAAAGVGLRHCPGRPTRWALERGVLEIARHGSISALLAADRSDFIAAGVLRDRLGLPGHGKQEAIAWVDLAAMRERLQRAGVPVVASAAVRTAADLHWLAHRWGYPLSVRRQRDFGWPEVAELGDAAEVTAFSATAFDADLLWVPGLVAERRTVGRRREDRATSRIARAAVDTLPELPGVSHVVELVRTDDGSELVDVVRCGDAGSPHRSVLAQAGLTARLPEVA